ncbi:NUMOD3 domain-containing DNA-binding protein [Nostoc sp.]|uniref:NUMOD3 domain-containing DNA-binding protein n=1 Tax=Nostoc sp. TaxID=1180 RepID=UPI002FF5D187
MTYTTAELKQTGIYAIINLDTGKRYIGSTGKNFSHRWSGHISSLRNNKHHSPRLQNAWNKYGEDKFEFKILEVVPKEEWVDNKYLMDIEQMYLDTYQPEYNICPTAGSNLGRVWSEEYRKTMSKALKGKRHSEESKQKMSLAKKGIPISEEASNKRKSKNHKHSQESLFKMSLKKKGSNNPMYGQRGENSKYSKEYSFISPLGVVHNFKGMSEFCKRFNLDKSTMLNVAKGVYKQHKGWTLGSG